MLVQIVLPMIMIVIMFSLGLGLRPADFRLVLAQPRAFGVGAFNQLLAVPLVAFLLATVFNLSPEFAFGLMIVAACPGGVLSNTAAKYAEGSTPLSVSLTAVISLVSIFTLPLVVAISASHFMGAAAPAINVAALGLQVFLLTAVPVGMGMVLTHYAPRFVEVAAPWISGLAFCLFLALLLAALATNWDVFIGNIGALGPVLVTLNAALLGIGVLTSRLAKLSARNVTTIAIESGIQNGSLGIAVATIVAGTSVGFPGTTMPAVLYSITAWILTIPFIFWRRNLAVKAR